jgi:two-component system OmpR family sensor kinase
MTRKLPLPGVIDPHGSDPLAEAERRVAALTAALASRDAFIAVAAHELRNPMTPMMGHLDLLISGVKAGHYTPSHTVHRLEQMQQSVRRFWKRASCSTSPG